ncbi:thymidylate synthase/dCMP hydroxymethylase domain-containing protein [Aspergillus pseudoustus]|uniref:thymidylate synthase n=1 Tax=Aspergillus pseudoustus TaxID=1810923 RepID=A0ABR4JHM9_9EURO
MPAVPSPPHDPSHEEHQYLHLIRDILLQGQHRLDRIGTGTRSILAPPQLHFSLSKPNPEVGGLIPALPLLTTDQVIPRVVMAEFLWSISAGIKIGDEKWSRKLLHTIGLGHHEEGNPCPVLGFQWRHFGARYVDAQTNYTEQGIAQLKDVVNKLIKNPFNHHIVINSRNSADRNPVDQRKMALPACHIGAQFYGSFPPGINLAEKTKRPTEKGALSCMFYQRSCDIGLDVPPNIASYALLTHILAHAADLQPGKPIHTIGNGYVYLHFANALNEQLTREPTEFHKLRIKRNDHGSAVVDGWKETKNESRAYH